MIWKLKKLNRLKEKNIKFKLNLYNQKISLGKQETLKLKKHKDDYRNNFIFYFILYINYDNNNIMNFLD